MSNSVSPLLSDTPTRRAVAARAVPGLAVGAVVAAAALGLNAWIPTASPLLVAIVAGAAVANTGRLSPRLEPGLAVASRRLLRIGVALLGLQLALSDVLRLGWGVICVVVAVVAFGIAGGLFMGRRLGLSRSQSLLIAGGFSICGAAAAAAVDGVIESDDDELVTSVALVVLFGTAMIPLLPLLAGWIGLAPAQAGMWAGASIHEVAQVVAASGVIGSGALAVAVVVKLGRVLMLAPVLALVSLAERRRTTGATRATRSDDGTDRDGAHVERRGGRPPLVPLFVLGFVALMLVRSSGLVPSAALSLAKVAETALLTVAMFALGTGVRVGALRRVGGRPFALAALTTVWVAAVSLGGILLVT
ncbi:putative sulfate exporter family transporter [Terrabacter aerolatus]|uniref:Membrane protein n=1 Tax=Terrabacter aerolatus TaxID=422442 RepID=A0A512CVW1_9MICO|nr:putative sulfate exporter family transporter [Terrabacter aerolatus]GEO28369.1 membrane protein [Terrabacter aerolatus]